MLNMQDSIIFGPHHANELKSGGNNGSGSVMISAPKQQYIEKAGDNGQQGDNATTTACLTQLIRPIRQIENESQLLCV